MRRTVKRLTWLVVLLLVAGSGLADAKGDAREGKKDKDDPRGHPAPGPAPDPTPIPIPTPEPAPVPVEPPASEPSAPLASPVPAPEPTSIVDAPEDPAPALPGVEDLDPFADEAPQLPLPEDVPTDDAALVPVAVPLFGPTESTTQGAAPASVGGPSLLWGIPLAGLLLLGVVLSSGRLVQPRPLPRKEPASTRAQAAPAPAPQVLVAVQPRDLEGMLRAAQAAVVAGRFEEGVAWFDKALRVNPRLAVAHFCRAVCLVGLKRDADAYPSFRKAYDLNPAEGAYRLELARVCARIGRAGEAMDVLGALLHAMPALVEDVSTDPSFAGLYDHPRFLAMTGRL